MNFLVKIEDRNGNPRARVVEAPDPESARVIASERFNLSRNGTILGVGPTTKPISAYHKR